MGIAVGLGRHHRRRAEVGRDHAGHRDERLAREDPAGDPRAREGHHGQLERRHAALAVADRQSEDHAGEHGLAGAEHEAP